MFNIKIVCVVVWTYVSFFQGTNGQRCTNKYFGTNNPNNKDNRNDKSIDALYLLGTDQQSDCCGLVSSWRASYDDVDVPTSVNFGIWRESATAGTFELIGENVFTINNDGDRTHPVAATQRILILPDDRFGWWNTGEEIIAYRNDANFADVKKIINAADVTVGGSQDFSTAPSISANTYAIRINVVPDTLPVFDNLPASTTIWSTDPAGISLFTPSASDADQGPSDPVGISFGGHSEFAFATGVLNTGTLTTLSGTITLTFSVTDLCDNLVTSTFAVLIINRSPVFNNLPTSNSVSEDETAETLMFTISVTDADPLTCTKAASVPGTYPFTVKPIVASPPDYGIYLDATPNLSYTTQSEYRLQVTCTDTVNTVTSGDYWVYVTKNLSPTFTNLQGTTSASTTMPIGTTIFTVSATDPEGDTITFSMTGSPASYPFTLDTATGVITTTVDLTAHSVVGYHLYISMTDGRNNVGPDTLTVTFADLNNAVTIDNLPIPSPLAIPENTPLGHTVFAVTFRDLDTGQAHTFTLASTPPAGLTYFAIDTGGVITTSGTIIDYEALAAYSFVLSVTCADPLVSDTKSLTVDVFNVNEAPAFGAPSYNLARNEGLANDVVGTPTYGITDPDAGDTKSLSMDCGIHTSYFHIDATSGTVKFQIDYDLDVGAKPTTVACNLVVTDSGGLSATSSLTITINDVNDNAPVFYPKNYNFFLSYFAGTSALVGTVTATDSDAGAFGTFTYSLDQSSLATPHFAIAANGAITLTLAPQAVGSVLNYTLQYTILAVATDGGGSTDTATVVIAISDTTTTTTTAATTTATYVTFFKDVKTWAWGIPCAILVFITIIITAGVLVTCRGEHGCKACLKTYMNRNKVKTSLKNRDNPPYREYKRPRTPINLSMDAVPKEAKDPAWRTAQRF